MLSDFRLLATGQTLSWIGNGFQTVALAVAIVQAGGGAGDLGIVMACSFTALLACSLLGGVWADRLQPRRVMVASDLVRLLCAAAIAVMFLGGGYHLVLLCGLTAISSGAGSFFNPAMTALRPLLVPIERRQAANATLSMLQTGSSVAGPALGGLTVAAFGAPAGFAVNAVSFLGSMAACLLLRARATRGPRTSMLRELGAGWREISGRDWLLGGLLGASVYHVANGVILVLVQVIAIQRLGGASAAGFIAAAEGLGGMIGAAVALRFKPRRLLRAGWLTLMLMPLWAFAYVWPATLTAVLAGAIIGWSGLIFFDVAWQTALQDRIPQSALGRVASWDTLTSFMAMPIGNVLAGPLSDRFGLNPVLTVCAGVLFVSAASQLLIPGSRTLTRVTAPAAPRCRNRRWSDLPVGDQLADGRDQLRLAGDAGGALRHAALGVQDQQRRGAPDSQLAHLVQVALGVDLDVLDAGHQLGYLGADPPHRPAGRAERRRELQQGDLRRPDAEAFQQAGRETLGLGAQNARLLFPIRNDDRCVHRRGRRRRRRLGRRRGDRRRRRMIRNLDDLEPRRLEDVATPLLLRRLVADDAVRAAPPQTERRGHDQHGNDDCHTQRVHEPTLPRECCGARRCDRTHAD
jgi:MFS family permease